ncbi:endonuclease/exonuclease/phosphatase family protein [Puerhibacterium sp. TATVAM-FAB25]|uniref:endonuclease/exonuclease/phosphatase family protein n=1 Tax=Puerhibacterium sp. TATVAM-FAB25 TaxID=3093699 RepID=UPI00397BCCE2
MIRLVTFNVQHGRGDDGATDADRLARAVAALDADVVALQEVDRGQARSGGADLARAVAEAVGAHDHRYVPALAGPVGASPLVAARAAAGPGRRARPAAVVRALLGAGGAGSAPGAGTRRARGDEPPEVPAYGIALLSRHPVRAWHRVRLPVGTPWLLGRVRLGPDEPRAAVAAVVETPQGPLTVVNTHLSSWRRWNRVQLRWLARRLRGAPRPLVLLGDLNIPGDLPAQRTGWRDVVTAPTFPRRRPRSTIDHVLLDGAVRATGPARAVDLGLSDHLAVVVDLEVGPDLEREPER